MDDNQRRYPSRNYFSPYYWSENYGRDFQASVAVQVREGEEESLRKSPRKVVKEKTSDDSTCHWDHVISNGGLKFSSAARSNVHGWSYPYKTVTFMHNCLSIPEITSTIFGYLLYEYDAREYKQILQRRHLLALLKTCRTFYHPALALLWSVLYSPAPLLLTMPEDLVELGTGTPPLTIVSVVYH